MRNRIIPVITISTNTDYKRNLIRDSFCILKFTNDYELDTIDCVEPNSDEETSLQENIKRKNELESMAARMSVTKNLIFLDNLYLSRKTS